MSSNKSNNNNHFENNINNIEILIRLYCFQEDIKGKIKNYDKYKENYLGIIVNKDFIEEYQKLLDYKTFINKLINDKKNKHLFDCLKDENGIINHEKLDENNYILTIIDTFKKTNIQLVEKINKIDLIQSMKNKSLHIKCKILEDVKLLLVDEFELINSKVFDLISKQLSIKTHYDICKFMIGKDYLYLYIYITVNQDPHIVSGLGKFDKNSNNFQMKYVFNIKESLRNEFNAHIQKIRVDAVINTIKSLKGNDNYYLLGNDKINYYKIEKNKIKEINNEPDIKKIKEKNVYTNDIQFQKNEMLQKLIYLYCYYSNIYNKTYSNDINNISEKVYLINSKNFLEIKIDLQYKILKDELNSNGQIQKIIEDNELQMINIDDIIKLLPPNYTEKYKKKTIKLKKDFELEPIIATSSIPSQNDFIMFYEEFEILDKLILNYFFDN